MMLNLDHTRHSGIFNAEDTSVVIVGAGGIGAITALTLAKMGVGYLEVWDGDKIESVNVATQWHSAAMIGKNKAVSLGLYVGEFAPGVQYYPHPRNMGPNDPIVANIVISALDSINTRKMVWKNLFKDESKWLWYLDARMGAEEFQLYSVDHSNDWDWYEEYIGKWSDDDVAELPCTEKATIYTANGAASYIGATVKSIITKQPVPKVQAMNFKEGQYVNV